MSDLLSTLKEAYLSIESLESRLREAEARTSEPVAIVGMACRFPGGSNTPERFWSLLERGGDAVAPIPPSRWPMSAQTPSNIRWAALLHPEEIETFDTAFFGISPREADSLDPQQRLSLEVSWEALENAGIPADALRGSRTGVYLGMMYEEYQERFAALDTRELFHITGGFSWNMSAGRISYTLGLQGPCMTVTTACSSSLTTVHLALTSLRLHETDLALAGGVSVIVSPTLQETYLALQALSPDGRCKTFDAGANGYVRGEGCGMLVLKRLPDAQRDGDRILAVIRGSALNQDGRSAGLTAPNVKAQQAVIRAALQNAGLTPDAIGYVEAHGTGTPLGDPIELEALTAVLGRSAAGVPPCYVSSCKTNVGHLEGCAGVAGLIKAVLMLQHGHIPPHVHFRALNPRIDLDGSRIQIPVQGVPWPRGARVRRAGISSFGISGCNAHVIVEEAPVASSTAPVAAEPAGPRLLPLSTRTPGALRPLAKAWADALRATTASLSDWIYTASVRRSHHPVRVAVMGETATAMADALDAFAAGQPAEAVVEGPELSPGAERGVVFVFPGHGSQWLGMARDLLQAEPAFGAAMAACDEAIRAEAGWSVLDELQASEAGSRLDRVDVIQPLLFAIEVGLAALWRSWGVVPDAVVGHSMGEVAAAHVAGALSLPDAARVICRRSARLRQVSGAGAMGSVELGPDDLTPHLSGWNGSLCIGVVNSPTTSVVSGSIADVEAFAAHLQGIGIPCRRVKTDVAFHSPQMDPLRPELVADLAGLAPHAPTLPLYSTVTAAVVEGEAMGPEYWGDNLRQPVQFARAIQQLIDAGYRMFIELSPHPILLPALAGMLPADGHVVASLRREQPSSRVLLAALAQLYVRGCPIDWSRRHPTGHPLVLPGYPWQRERFWIDLPDEQDLLSRQGGHPLMGHAIRLAEDESKLLWQRDVSFRHLTGLTGGEPAGPVAVLPPAAWVDMALVAAREALGDGPVTVEPFELWRPLEVSRERPTRLQVTCARQGSEAVWQASSAAPGQGWILHATARLRQAPEPPPVPAADLHPVELPASAAPRPFLVHPALLQAAWRGVTDPQQVTSIDRIHLLSPVSQEGWCADPDGRALWLFTSGATVRVEGWRSRAAGAPRSLQHPELLYSVAWDPVPLPPPPAGGAVAAGTWLILADEGGVGAELSRRLEGQGQTVVTLSAGTLAAAPASLESALRTVEASGSPCRGVVTLWALDLPAEPGLEPLAGTLLAVGAVVRALSLLDWRSKPRLWLVTRQAHVVGKPLDDVNVTQAPICGLTRTLAIESPELQPTHVDLGADTAAHAEALLHELLASSSAEEVALRSEGRYAAHLIQGLPADVRAAREPVAGRPWRVKAAGSQEPEWQLDEPPAPGGDEVAVTLSGVCLQSPDLGSLRAGWGTVTSIGAHVRDLAVGDRVLTLESGELASSPVLPAWRVHKGAGLRPEVVAASSVDALTAHVLVHTLARLAPGERAVVLGAGTPLGQAAIRAAQQAGAQVHSPPQVPPEIDVILCVLPHVQEVPWLDRLSAGGRLVGLSGSLSPGVLTSANVSVTLANLPAMLAARPAAVGQAWEAVLDRLATDGDGTAAAMPCLPVSRLAEALDRLGSPDASGVLLELDDPQVAVPRTDGLGLRTDGTYLVVGGLGGLGLAVCEWLVRQGARSLAVLSRRGRVEGDEATAAVARWTEAGTAVQVLACDVSSRASLTEVLATVRRHGPPLRGVFQMAGVAGRDVLASEMTRDDVMAGLGPKVAGTWNLHELTVTDPLDCFVVYSSMSSVQGTMRRGVYSAGNAFLDAMAWYRRRHGRPALAVSFGVSAGVGMAAYQADAKALTLDTISPEEGLEVLDDMLKTSLVHVGAARFNVRQWVDFFPQLAPSSMLATLLQGAQAATQTSDDFLRAVRACPEGQRLARVEQFVRDQAALVLHIEPARLQRETPFNAQGFDSLMGLELRNRLEAGGIGVKLSATLIFTYPTVASVASYLLERMVPAAPSLAPAPVDTGARDARQLAELEALSEEAQLAMLEAALSNLETK